MAKSEFYCDCSVIHEESVDFVRSIMIEPETYDAVAGFFKILGDPTRIRIIWALAQRELCVCDIANILGMTKSAVSHQLGMMRRGKLVKCRREGKTVYYSIADDHVELMLKAGLEHAYE